MGEDGNAAEDFVTRLLPASTQVSFGALSGWAAGYALRQGGKVAGVLVGGGFMFLQSMAYLGYVEVDWRKVERDYKGILDKDKDGKITVKDFELIYNNATEALKFNLPAGSGFTAGFGYGLSGSAKMALGAASLYGGATSLALGGVPTDLFTSEGVQRIASDGYNTLSSTVFSKMDPKEALERKLNTHSIEELRQLEFELKHDINVSAQLMGIDAHALPKEEMMAQIESSKRFVKAQM